MFFLNREICLLDKYKRNSEFPRISPEVVIANVVLSSSSWINPYGQKMKNYVGNEK